MSIPTAFADRLINMSIHNGLVRMEFGTGQSAVEDGKQTTKYETTQSIVMPLDGFANALRLQQRLMSELVDRANKAKAAAGDAAAPATGA
ncbi:MAG TPA: hypothetical protein PK072_05290 [Quisquiliibacterium sp.]|nr:hypothetical protein [Quisquiliibacterium sp.]HQD82561.1 hypothetical protein [Quisquiliibacterium sp.]HQN11592.1 hypothetical protein [Quisquiliibacterium sp.]HQP66041.1 hypothetical protein [Quisquiliibacterium sp.]